MVKLVTFQLGVDLFAVDVHSAERVVRYTPPNSVPDAPHWIEGVLDYRDKVIPVVDMRRRIELAETEVTPDTRILVLVTKDGWVGAVVDTVHEVAPIKKDEIAPPPPLFRGLSSDFVRGIAKVNGQIVVVLDVERVLSSTDRIAFEKAVENAVVPARV
jgi:purine-binding chemotaxis protein CheW